MAKKSKFGSMKRFGPRYGRRNKEKVASLEQEYRFKHKCPYCNYEQLKRLSAGIWECVKCKVKFAGKAYTTPKKTKVKTEKVEERVEDMVLEPIKTAGKSMEDKEPEEPENIEDLEDSEESEELAEEAEDFEDSEDLVADDIPEDEEQKEVAA